MSDWQLREAARALRRGGIIAYPTEAVFGLGCDPGNQEAVLRLLALKHRSISKGLILVAAHFDQLTPWVALSEKNLPSWVLQSWPGPHTWLLPATATPGWLTGTHRSLAVRVSAHPLVSRLCETWGGALVSTSANPAGKHPARDRLGVRRVLPQGIDYILPGQVGSLTQPTPIRDALTGVWIRT